MSSSLLILTCVSRKIDETDEISIQRRERDQEAEKAKRKKEAQNQPLAYQGRTEAEGRQLFPLDPRLAEAATGLARRDQRWLLMSQ